jgi:hypothetical protein
MLVVVDMSATYNRQLINQNRIKMILNDGLNLVIICCYFHSIKTRKVDVENRSPLFRDLIFIDFLQMEDTLFPVS